MAVLLVYEKGWAKKWGPCWNKSPEYARLIVSVVFTPTRGVIILASSQRQVGNEP